MVTKWVNYMSETINYCSLCGRSEEKTGKLMNFQMFRVCPDCMQRTMDQMNQFTNDDILKMYSQMAGGTQEMETTTDKTINDETVSGNDNVEEKDEKASEENKSDKKPGIHFINLGDFQNVFRPQKEVKQKKKAPRNYKKIETMADLPKPHEIRKKLDEYVVGQDKAKKVLSVAVYNHYKRVITNLENDKKGEEEIEKTELDDAISEFNELGTEIEKSNVLMLGPTGSGKTYLVKTLARLLNVPLAITDATSLTEAGYIGDDIESVVSKLLAEADNDVERAEQGIIFIDEIDKIAKKKNSHARDVSGESVQQGMLKLLEGADIEVPVGANSKNAMVPLQTINTKNILFICGGAFPDLDEIIKKRLTKSSSMGYSATLKNEFDKEENIFHKVTPEDLREFGMIPEFIGRLPVVFALDGITEEMMVKILMEPRNAIIKQYKKLLEMDEVKLEFEDEALALIAKKAMEKKTGARALRAIIEEIMLDIMYEVPKDESIGTVSITDNYINGIGGPKIETRV